MKYLPQIEVTLKIDGEIVIKASPESDGMRFRRRKTYSVEHRRKFYTSMKAFRSVRKGERVIVFQSTPQTIINGTAK
jgi:hypothetical protein